MFKHSQLLLQNSGRLPPSFTARTGCFSMRHWLTIQCEKRNDLRLSEFIQANPDLDDTMRALLANYLNLSEPNLQAWIQEFQHCASEYSSLFINVAHSAH